ncbi:MAG: DUF3857 domain-containing protein [bacterium]|nr:DUF3857 domain-containing protein [bacterium]
MRFLFPILLVVLALPAFAADSDLPPGDKPAPTPFSRLADAGTADDHDDADHVIVLEHAVNRVKPSGVTYVDGYRLVKLLTPAACRDLSVLNWHYDPQSQALEVREVAILRDDERIPVNVAAVHDLPAPQAAIYWRDRVKTLQLPRLEVGDGIEVKTFSKGFTYALLAQGGGAAGGTHPMAMEPGDEKYIPPMPGEYFDIVLFQTDAPVVEKRYDLVLPKDKRLHAETYNGALYSSVTYDEITTTYSWWCLDMPARVHEPRQPAASDIIPKAVMATAESWEAKSRWFFDVNKDQFDVTPAIQAKVDEIIDTQGLKKADDEKKAKALLHWVAQNIRYSGQTMGEGEGFTLHPGDMIFEQRSGVCKDIAGMLVTMMRGAGLDSYAAMTMAGSRIDEVPADQFNHCVTALKLDDGSFRMYDPTWVPYNNDIWSKLETEQHYLVGTPEGEHLTSIAFSPPAESPLTARHEARLSADGTLEGTVRFDGGGASDSRLRRIVNGQRMKELNARCARILSNVSPRVEAVEATHRATDDFSGNMWLEISYRIPRFVTEMDGALEFTSPLMGLILADGSLFGSARTEWDEERTTDLLVWYTQQVDAQETIRLPKGWKLNEPPEMDAVDETYASFSGAAELDGRKLKVTQLSEVRRRQIPPDGYEGFRKAMTAAKDWADETIRLTKEGE